MDLVLVTSYRSSAVSGTDADVIGRSRQVPELFAALFDRHYRYIYAYAAKRLGPGLAEDVASETFLIAFGSRDRYDTARTDARPWLYGIASNLIARHARTECRRYQALARTGGAGSVNATDSTGSAEVIGRIDAAAARGRLAEALGRIGEPVRDVLLLVAWAGLSCQEAADALGIPAGTARSRLHRARQEMRAALGSTLDIEVNE
jgi:RNA polymerase sigma-70 factor (ECF subfamily)